MTGRAEQFLQARGDRLHAHFRIRLALGTAQMAREDQSSALLERVLDGRERRLDTLVGSNFLSAASEGNIEVHANEHALVLEIEITNG